MIDSKGVSWRGVITTWWRVSKIGVADPIAELEGPADGRRLGHPRNRTLCEDRSVVAGSAGAGAWAPAGGDHPSDQQRRTGHVVRDAGPAQLHQRSSVAALRPRSPGAPVPLPARSAGLQQAAARARRHRELADPP